MNLKITTAIILRLKDFLFIIKRLLRYYFFQFLSKPRAKYLLRFSDLFIILFSGNKLEKKLKILWKADDYFLRLLHYIRIYRNFEYL